LSATCTTAARYAVVADTIQNCSFRHHSPSVMPDHLTSRTATIASVSISAARKATYVADGGVPMEKVPAVAFVARSGITGKAQ